MRLSIFIKKAAITAAFLLFIFQ